ncbi:uncharacterized protein MONBRDRAFT_26815 [Monosiga brevicollis MX1]|uniref:Uncharacterized protein n=1 Tax=Monosiga brevicollis TaxID=81824 RepID=A9V3L5_MONBE|nr:uncharacterized protein MONBRDRAFT_26815 [Monosiga brevicollis MX1]EDQ87835.1 predicted protein [Monosiga brevicollis MX1]|eukprot:XP_001747368.1 hypothetical protein [Monosiga brevicollis MX1]
MTETEFGYEWQLEKEQDLAMVLTAMLNGRCCGRIIAPVESDINNLYDRLSSHIRENVLPAVDLIFETRSPEEALPASTLVTWNETERCVVVHTHDNMLRFNHFDAKFRVGATTTLATHEDLLNDLRAITVEHVTRPLTCNGTLTISDVKHLSVAEIEHHASQNKERKPTTLDALVNPELLYAKLEEHFKRYAVELYKVTADGRPIKTRLAVGVRDADACVTGIPLWAEKEAYGSLLEKLKKKLKDIVTKEWSRLFPTPNMQMSIGILEVQFEADVMPKLLGPKQQGTVLFAYDPKVVKPLLEHAEWHLVATWFTEGHNKLGIVVANKDNLRLIGCGAKPCHLELGKPSKRQTNETTWTHIGTEGLHFALVALDVINLVPHVMIELITLPNAASLVSSAPRLLRPSISSCATIVQAANGTQAPEPPALYGLSPLTTWALLRRNDIADLSRLWTEPYKSFYDVHVVAFAAEITAPASIYIELQTHVRDTLRLAITFHSGPLEIISPAEDKKALVLVCLGITMTSENMLWFGYHQSANFYLYDVNPKRLHHSMTVMLDRSLKVADVQLLRKWDDLCVPQVSPTAIPLPSEEGRQLIRAWLAGEAHTLQKRELKLILKQWFEDDALINKISPARNGEKEAIERITSLLRPGTVANWCVQAILPGTGTTTFLRRVAHGLRQHQNIRVQILDNDEAVEWPSEQMLSSECSPRFVIMLDSRSAQDAEQKVMDSAKAHLRSHASLAVVVVKVVMCFGPAARPDLQEFTLDPIMTRTEAQAAVDVYKSFFPEASSLDDLAQQEELFICLPGLVVTNHRVKRSKTIKQALDEMPYARELLAVLALLEIFTLSCNTQWFIEGPPLGDHKWLVRNILPESGRLCYRLNNWLLAVPILAAVGIKAAFDADAPGGLRVSGNGMLIKRLWSSAFIWLDQAQQWPLLNFLLHKRTHGMPHWLEVLSAHVNQGTIDHLFKELISHFSRSYDAGRPISDGARKKRGQSLVQLYVLRADRYKERGKWEQMLLDLDNAVNATQFTPSDQVARLHRAQNIVACALSTGSLVQPQHIDSAIKDFREAISDESNLFHKTARRCYEQLQARASLQQNHETPAVRLYIGLTNLLEDQPSTQSSESTTEGAATPERPALPAQEFPSTPRGQQQGHTDLKSILIRLNEYLANLE